jgi:oligopeptide/dipeptide ABC transporter ATP-binding protein
MSATDPILRVTNLRVRFETAEGTVRAVDGIDFGIDRDETVALVGESGCGKSVASLALARLASGPGLSMGGQVLLMGRDVFALPEREVRDLRGGGIAYIFQDPAASLNPVKTIGAQIAEAVRLHRRETDADAEAAELMERVGLSAAGGYSRAYPHQFSGGMQQRAMIAMALACRPQLLVADEPTTALDVTIQAQIFRLLDDVRRQFRMAVLITHNLGLVARNAGRVYVMYAGRIMESGPVTAVLRRPAHPYTKGLLAAVPRLTRTTERMAGIDGAVPHPARLPSGCRFHPRCRMAEDCCRMVEPELQAVMEGQYSRCYFWKRIT